MFGTLSYDALNQEPVFEAVTTLPNSITGAEPSKRGSTIHKACQLCRARKPGHTWNAGLFLSVVAIPAAQLLTRLATFSFAAAESLLAVRGVNRPSAFADIRPDRHDRVEDGTPLPHAMPTLKAKTMSLTGASTHGFQPLTASTLPATGQGITSPQSQAFSVDDYVFNAEDYSFKDYFGGSWQSQDVFESKTAADLMNTQNLALQLSLPTYDTTSSHEDPVSNCTTPDLEALDITGPEEMLGRAWSVTSAERTPELSLSSRASTSRSTSVETIGTQRRINPVDQDRVEGSEKCHCLGQVAQLLEEAEAGNAKVNASLDELLEYSREPLMRRNTLLACADCNSRPEYTLMLAMLAKSLSIVCHRLVQCHLQSRVEVDGGGTASLGWPDLRVGTYSIQDSMERFTVVEALILAKLRYLLDFITSLKGWAEGRDGVQVFLSQAEERTRELKSQIDQKV
ncbi:hypothetical protein HJFPF1_12554 [Paramyrothecium foliicola]|nr:hypothetical protein HJFPF1_12554 [Paramyrothecium foliicola]